MNFGKVARLLAGFTLFFSLPLAIPLLMALSEDAQLPTVAAFTESLVIGLVTAGVLWWFGRHGRGDLFRRESLAVVVLAWLLSSVMGALPFIRAGAIPGLADAFFESVSGLTTTGATVLGGDNMAIESVPGSLLLWRAMLQWIGGVGIIVVFIVLLPVMGVTGAKLLSTPQLGVSNESMRPRMKDQARQLCWLYVGLSAAAMLGYWAAGMSLFDAMCHSFTTLSTGGFSNHNVSVGGYQNLGVELVATLFMFFAGCNFLLLLRVVSPGTQSRNPLRDTEFRVYLGMTVAIILGLTLVLWIWGVEMRDDSLGITRDYSSLGRCLRDASFQAVSILTGTGYGTADFERWPMAAIYLFLVCLFVGACTGSTAGGFKILRIVVCFKLVSYSLRQFTRPRTVEKLKLDNEVIPNRIVSGILGLLVLWIATIAAGTFVLALDPRLDFLSAFTASMSMTSLVGPAISETVQVNGGFELVGSVDVGPYGGYSKLHDLAKIFMSVQMLLGRLEILAALVLLTPGFWQR